MPPTVLRVVLVVALGLMLGPESPSMVHAVPVEHTGATNTTRGDNQCSLLQDLLETRLNERESEVNTQLRGLQTQLKGLDTRLSTQLSTRHNEVNTRFNRMDGRLDGIEMAISDMKGYLQAQMQAINTKVEWALTDTEKPHVYTRCDDALRQGQTTSGVYTINPDEGDSFNVYCEQGFVSGGGWTVFQARQDGSVSFFKDWSSYKAGFGTLTGGFWLGNDKIHRLTKRHDQQLRVELVSPDGEVAYADYQHFWIEDEAHQYNLTVRGYTGGNPPGDSFTGHNGSSFSTKDRDNDQWPYSCANAHGGGWWYHSGCLHTNLNGVYSNTHGKGINWFTWKGFSVSMKAVRLLLKTRP